VNVKLIILILLILFCSINTEKIYVIILLTVFLVSSIDLLITDVICWCVAVLQSCYDGRQRQS